jgi:hypothetical protein
MRANERAVDEYFLEIRVLRQLRKDAMPDAATRPSGKTLIDTVPETERVGGKSAPRTAYTGNPQHRFNEQSIVARRTSRIPALPGSIDSIRSN